MAEFVERVLAGCKTVAEGSRMSDAIAAVAGWSEYADVAGEIEAFRKIYLANVRFSRQFPLLLLYPLPTTFDPNDNQNKRDGIYTIQAEAYARVPGTQASPAEERAEKVGRAYAAILDLAYFDPPIPVAGVFPTVIREHGYTDTVSASGSVFVGGASVRMEFRVIEDL